MTSYSTQVASKGNTLKLPTYLLQSFAFTAEEVIVVVMA